MVHNPTPVSHDYQRTGDLSFNTAAAEAMVLQQLSHTQRHTQVEIYNCCPVRLKKEFKGSSAAAAGNCHLFQVLCRRDRCKQGLHGTQAIRRKNGTIGSIHPRVSC